MTQLATPRRPGCFGYGCLIATILFCVAIGTAWFVGLRSLRGAVDRYTCASTEPLAPTAVDQELVNLAGSKWAELNAASIAGAPLSIQFSEGELQALVNETPWRDRVRVGLLGNEAKIQFSIPLSSLGDWVAASRLVESIKDRALVGSARVRLVPRDDAQETAASKDLPVQVIFQELILNEQVLDELPRGHASDWVSGALKSALIDPALRASFSPVFRAIQGLDLRDGRLIIAVGALKHD